jgi:hypothetical protein
MKQLFSEATLYRIAEAQTCTGIVVLTQISIVVLTYCRMAIRIYFNRETKESTGKSAMKCIYKTIFIYLFKDSKQ